MEDMAALWGYQESIDELKHKLLCSTFELESARAEASEETRKNKENMNQILQLLKNACQERDEARYQLQKLLNKAMPSPTPTEFFPVPPQLQPDIPLVKPTKANTSITESNSPSETHNFHSHTSSPVDSFFDPVSSPDSSNVAFVNHPFVQNYNNPNLDQVNQIIDNLAKGKTLPEKGKFLQAVLGAGPLLQSLLIAGPLPKWRNPPPLQPFNIPPVSIKGCDAEIVTEKPENSSHGNVRSMNPQSYAGMSCGSSLNFGNGSLINGGVSTTNSNVANGKKQRFQ